MSSELSLQSASHSIACAIACAAMKMTELSEAFFAALANADFERVRELCSPEFQGSQNGGPAMDRDTLIKFTGAVHAVVPDFHYEEAVRTATDSGFVEEHDVCGTLPDGSALSLTVCVVAEVTGGRITKIREYIDTAAAAGLMKALSRA